MWDDNAWHRTGKTNHDFTRIANERVGFRETSSLFCGKRPEKTHRRDFHLFR